MTPDDFHRRYPSFAPFIGERYAKRLHDDDGMRLLLVGESHYLPEPATLHLDADRWYRSDVHDLEREQDAWHRLHPDEKKKNWLAWIDTAGVVKRACTTNFVRRGHWIWKNAFEVVNEAGPRYDDPVKVADDIAFLNFFVRPARKGKSLKGKLTALDRELANAIFARRIAELRPTHVAFLSRLASKKVEPKILGALPKVATPHPTSHWWNRSSARYEGLRGRDLLDHFVRETWPTSSP